MFESLLKRFLPEDLSIDLLEGGSTCFGLYDSLERGLIHVIHYQSVINRSEPPITHTFLKRDRDHGRAEDLSNILPVDTIWGSSHANQILWLEIVKGRFVGRSHRMMRLIIYELLEFLRVEPFL